MTKNGSIQGFLIWLTVSKHLNEFFLLGIISPVFIYIKKIILILFFVLNVN